MRRLLACSCLTTFAAVTCVYACADPPVAPPPKTSSTTSVTPPASSVWPGSAPTIDPSVVADVPEAGSASACLPHTANADGDVEQYGMAGAGTSLAFCLSYTTPLPEAPSGRACYSVDLASGIFDRIAPSAPKEPRGAPDAVGKLLAEHASGGGAWIVKSDALAASACKRGTADCVNVKLEKSHAEGNDAGACTPRALVEHPPADVSPDGASLFVVRHEGCDGKGIFGEVYDVKKKTRVARWPLQAAATVTLASWLGARVLVRSCASLAEECRLALVDPKTGSAATIAGINAFGVDEPAFAVSGDVWAFVDRAGQRVVWAHESDGKIERKIDVPFAAGEKLRWRAAFGRRDAKQLWILHGGTARVMLVDLASGALDKNVQPPVCGERPRGL